MQPPWRLQFDASQRVWMKNYHVGNWINASQPFFDFLVIPRCEDGPGRELSTQFDRQIGLPRWRAGEGSKLKDLHTTELSARARYP